MNSDKGNRARGLPHFKWEGPVGELPSAVRKLVGTRTYQYVKAAYGWVKHEAADQTSLPLYQRLKMWRRGFFAESAAVYDLDRNDPGDYLSDFTRAARCRPINAHNEFFNHKLVLRSFLLAMGFRQAETIALLFDGRILGDPFSGHARHLEPEELISRLRARHRSYIVKPEDGAAGTDVFLLEHQGHELVLRRGRDTIPFDLGTLLHKSKTSERPYMSLIEERLEQGSFWRGLFPDSANTLRLLTQWTPGEPAPFVARAVQRIGTADTVPTDNWSNGGISAPVDLVSGTLGVGRRHPSKGRGAAVTQGYPHHPETGAQIAGTVLPDWDRITGTVLRAAASLPFNRIAGWDILVAPDGEPVIIEGNGNSDVDVFQVHGGLLVDPRVRRFYEACGVLGGGTRRPASPIAAEVPAGSASRIPVD